MISYKDMMDFTASPTTIRTIVTIVRLWRFDFSAYLISCKTKKIVAMAQTDPLRLVKIAETGPHQSAYVKREVVQLRRLSC